MPAAAVTRRWIVRPIRQYTRAALDKRSSLDSLQQALFFSVLTGKRPAVVISGTDGTDFRNSAFGDHTLRLLSWSHT